ncbi:precorrin-2 dehydrogenase/sirohydrochlorin ferrochelatase family protein [Luteococcus sp. OSA5]|uniref:precorrin-2 dehydrogenase/sirohydrochlorin ferrochelatase family protein n=1 Tax=Luteococcus sp. OSA5 TaxID=3401630 RepID=UPI003B429E70
MPAPQMYLSGLDLRGRRVLLVGAGRVATRRIQRLLDAGADLLVVAPQASERIRSLAEEGRLTWLPRAVQADDLAGAWYVMAASDDVRANELVSAEALRRRIFCVRSDRASAATAWTPAVEVVGDFLVGVLGNRDPLGSVALRKRIRQALDS